MFTNFLNLWILARVVQAGVATSLCGLGTILGLRIARRWRSGQSSETQLALERQAELVASVMQVALLFEILGLALTVLVTNHLVGGIRGAMCAFGVLASTSTGFLGLAVSVATAVACGLWMTLHRFDLTLELPVLTRRKFLALLAVGPLALLDLALVLRFAFELDFSVIASCCSVWVDDTAINARAARWVMSPNPTALLGVASAGSALIAGLALWRRPGRATALTAATLAAIAPLAVLPAILGVIAPYATATPGHLCPFCLFHAQGGYVGWPLFAALFVGSVAGMGAGVVELNRSIAGADAPARTLQRRLGRRSAIGWACVLGCGAFPVIRYLILSRGVSVFGEV